MRQHVPHIEQSRPIVDLRYEPETITANVEHNASADLIGVRELTSQFREVLPFRTLADGPPCVQRLDCGVVTFEI
jgi:hypothetical protein